MGFTYDGMTFDDGTEEAAMEAAMEAAETEREGFGFDEFVDLEAEARDYEIGAEYGDPRRCPKHPHVATSSPDGMFDAPCGACEYEGDKLEAEAEEAADRARFPGGRCISDDPNRSGLYPRLCETSSDEDIPF